MDAVWQEYGMEELERGMQKLFPAFHISVSELMGQLLQGDVLGAAGSLLQEVMQGMGDYVAGRKNILIWQKKIIGNQLKTETKKENYIPGQKHF